MASTSPMSGLGERLDRATATLPPDYFAMVMATGIVSMAAHLHGLPLIADGLFRLNVVLYAGFCLINAVRFTRHTRRVLADMRLHSRGPGFFTWVAATAVLGTQITVLAAAPGAGLVLWVIAALLWLLLTYAVFALLFAKENKPSLEKGVHGGWLGAVVATQSIAVLGARLSPQLDAAGPLVDFVALAMWLFGGTFYLWLISIIFYRYAFVHFSAADLTPPYWIDMGAMAISAVAGTELLAGATAGDPLLAPMAPFLHGLTLTFWATATWWIPLLVLLEIWRHAIKRYPVAYSPDHWSGVFPLGMYTVSTYAVGHVLKLPLLLPVARLSTYVALLAWIVVFIGWTRALWRLAVGPQGVGRPSG